jgi:hypothetical protein
MKKNITLVVVVFVLTLITVCNYSRIIQKEKLEEMNTLLDSYSKHLNNSKNYQGVLIGENLGSMNKSYNEFMVRNSISHHLFVFVDTIDCYSCFKFHMEEIKKIDLPIIYLTHSSVNHELLRSHLGEKNLFKNTCFVNQHKKIFSNNLFIALINDKGRIIYLDVADKTNYKKSKVFYEVIQNYIID